MIRGSATFIVAVLGVWLGAIRGVAQSPSLPASYTAVKGGISFAGGLSVNADGMTLRSTTSDKPIVILPVDDTSSLGASFDGEATYMFSVHRNFALGPAWGLHTWRSNRAAEAGSGTSLGLDLTLVPQVRFPLSGEFEIYVSLPLGMTFSILNEYKTWTDGINGSVGQAEDVDPTYGFAFGAYLGVRYALSGQFGVLSEIGYQRYQFAHSVEFSIHEDLDSMGLGTTLDLSMVTQQVRWNVGVFF